MNPSRRQDPERLNGGDTASGRLLGALREPTPPPGARERVWGQLASPRRVSPAWFALIPAAAAMAMTVFVLRPRASAAPFATVSLSDGRVDAAGPGRPFEPARVGQQLAAESRVRTQTDGRAYVRFADAGALLSSGTSAHLRASGAGVSIELEQGRVCAAVRPRPPERAFLVVAGDYTIRVVGTLFSVSAREDRSVQVRVREGTVEVTGPSTRVLVHAGESWDSKLGAGLDSIPGEEAILARTLRERDENEAVLNSVSPPAAQTNHEGLPQGPQGAAGVPAELATSPVGSTASPSGHHEAITQLGNPVEARPEPVAAESAPPVFPASSRWVRSVPRKHATEGPKAATPSPNDRDTTAPAPESHPSWVEAPASPSSPTAVSHAAPPVVAALSPAPIAEPAAASPRPTPAEPPQAPEETDYSEATHLIAQGRYAEAVGLLDKIAQAGGRKSGLALYEAGRVRQRNLADPMGAAKAFGEYVRRFPAGDLAQEASVSRVEALFAANQVSEAVSATNVLLSAYPGNAHRSRLILLRARAKREQGNIQAALADYALLVDTAAPEADDATFEAAWCERSLGLVETGQARLRTYLERFPGGRHKSDAEAALRGQ